jgi:hypothetical protein
LGQQQQVTDPTVAGVRRADEAGRPAKNPAQEPNREGVPKQKLGEDAAPRAVKAPNARGPAHADDAGDHLRSAQGRVTSEMSVAFCLEEQFALVTPAADHAVSHKRRGDSIEHNVANSDLIRIGAPDQNPLSVVDRMAHAESGRLERNLFAARDDILDKVETDSALERWIHGKSHIKKPSRDQCEPENGRVSGAERIGSENKDKQSRIKSPIWKSSYVLDSTDLMQLW